MGEKKRKMATTKSVTFLKMRFNSTMLVTASVKDQTQHSKLKIDITDKFFPFFFKLRTSQHRSLKTFK